MARGAKKSLQEKITLKEELIESLSIRIKKEREELNELLEQQKDGRDAFLAYLLERTEFT